MVSVLVSSAVEHALLSTVRSGITNDYEIGICCFSAKSAALRSKRKVQNQDNVSEWSKMSTCGVQNQDNVSEWSKMSTCGMLFQ